ncbi:hypothetical protein Dip518_000638 [Parelusimicrobium proximum]|uniref:tetratricopeptide repeat protein n=1 Tax=Parelusimicrobium proximum TaxID=3228953 RepID=UPI003D17009C
MKFYKCLPFLFLGMFLLTGCITTSNKTDSTIAHHMAAAQQGDAEAQYIMALAYYEGKGVKQDYKKANYWLTKTNEQVFELSKAQYIDEYTIRTLFSFQKAVEQNDAEAQYKVGLAYERGDYAGIEKNYETAKYWLKKAADQGLPTAQTRLGTLYINADQDMQTGKYWIEKAAKQGDTKAQELLKKLEQYQ